MKGPDGSFKRQGNERRECKHEIVIIMEAVKLAGPLLLSTMIGCGLYGVLCMQIYAYHTTFPGDPRTYKALVHGVLALETTQTFILAIDVVDALAIHQGDVASLDNIRMYWFSGPILIGIVTAIGHLFFAYRLWILAESWVPAIVIAVLSIGALGAAMATGTLSFSTGTLIGPFFGKSSISYTIWHWMSIVCDVSIVVCMLCYLTRHEVIPDSRLSQHINRLMRLVIETGIATASANLLCFVLFAKFKQTTYYAIPYLMTSKLYSNTMLLILNNRIGRESQGQGTEMIVTNGSKRPYTRGTGDSLSVMSST